MLLYKLWSSRWCWNYRAESESCWQCCHDDIAATATPRGTSLQPRDDVPVAWRWPRCRGYPRDTHCKRLNRVKACLRLVAMVFLQVGGSSGLPVLPLSCRSTRAAESSSRRPITVTDLEKTFMVPLDELKTPSRLDFRRHLLCTDVYITSNNPINTRYKTCFGPAGRTGGIPGRH